MIVRIELKNPAIAASFLVAVLITVVLLGRVVINDFIVYSIVEDASLSKELLAYAAGNYPGSPRLLARLASAERADALPDLDSAERHIVEAISLSPNNYQYRLLLAKIRNDKDDQKGAEAAMREALRISPNSYIVHWALANLLVRGKRIDESIEHFRFAADYNPICIASALDLVWQVSGENLSYLRQIVGDNPRGQVKLALFLAGKSKLTEAVEVFKKVDRETAFAASETSPFIDLLIAKGYPRLADEFWRKAKYGVSENVNRSLIWNGDFETEPLPEMKQFEWQIDKTSFARITIDGANAHSGSRSLSIEFLGKDTTRIEYEIRHLFVLRPGTNGQLTFFVKTEKYFSPNQGVVVIVTNPDGAKQAESKPVPLGDNAWQQMTVDLNPPKAQADGIPLFVWVRRIPRYDYDEPTKGRVWFDDFAVREVGGK
jgi:tetratricopeptide (TPR) repeat protein